MRARVADLISSRRFEWAIIVLVVLNALILGLETAPPVMALAGAVAENPRCDDPDRFCDRTFFAVLCPSLGLFQRRMAGF